jgi:hypothetical protein
VLLFAILLDTYKGWQLSPSPVTDKARPKIPLDTNTAAQKMTVSLESGAKAAFADNRIAFVRTNSYGS